MSNFTKKVLSSFCLAYLTPPHHLEYFSTSSSDKLLADNGFRKTESWRTRPNFRHELGSSSILLNICRGGLLSLSNMRWLGHLASFLITFLTYTGFRVLTSEKIFLHCRVCENI